MKTKWLTGQKVPIISTMWIQCFSIETLPFSLPVDIKPPQGMKGNSTICGLVCFITAFTTVRES